MNEPLSLRFSNASLEAGKAGQRCISEWGAAPTYPGLARAGHEAEAALGVRSSLFWARRKGWAGQASRCVAFGLAPWVDEVEAVFFFITGPAARWRRRCLSLLLQRVAH